jgi:hypothetical protein
MLVQPLGVLVGLKGATRRTRTMIRRMHLISETTTSLLLALLLLL